MEGERAQKAYTGGFIPVTIPKRSFIEWLKGLLPGKISPVAERLLELDQIDKVEQQRSLNFARIKQLEAESAEFCRIATEALAVIKQKDEALPKEKMLVLKAYNDNDIEYNRELSRIYDSEEFKWYMYRLGEQALMQFKSNPDMTEKQRAAFWAEAFDVVMQGLLKHERIYSGRKHWQTKRA